jgi:tryptophan synthase alpha chain
MNRITKTVRALNAKGEGAFMPFVVIGDPDFTTCLRITGELVEAGADILEFGFPFSDPPADGPVIQASDVRALEAGMTPPRAFEFLDEVKRRYDKPVALLMYFNLIMQYGVEAFYARAAKAGVDAVLVADVPIEASAELIAAARQAEVAPIFIGSRLTSDDRLRQVAKVADGYLYAVARVGITGEQAGVDDTLADTLKRLKEAVDVPVLAGFGISTPEHVRTVLAGGADGVICGSALVRRIEEHLGDEEGMASSIRHLAAALKGATYPD